MDSVIITSMENTLIICLGIVVVLLNTRTRVVEPPRDMDSRILPGDRIVEWVFSAENAIISFICLVLMFILGM